MSTAPTLAFICSAGCPEIVTGFWIVLGGSVCLLATVVGLFVRLGSTMLERPSWTTVANRLVVSGGIGLAAALAFTVLLVAIGVRS